MNRDEIRAPYPEEKIPEARATPVEEQLDSVPLNECLDIQMIDEEGAVYGYHHIPVGYLAKDASEQIRSLKKQVASLEKQMGVHLAFYRLVVKERDMARDMWDAYREKYEELVKEITSCEST